jgi:hypothetical protein
MAKLKRNLKCLPALKVDKVPTRLTKKLFEFNLTRPRDPSKLNYLKLLNVFLIPTQRNGRRIKSFGNRTNRKIFI